jgi:hypothetical protein
MMPVYSKGLLSHSARLSKQLCLLLLCICSNTLYAQQLSPSDAAASARNFTDGKVLTVKPIQGTKIDYRVKILSPEGRVRNIIVDGDSGEILLHKKSPKRDKKILFRQQTIKTGF